MRASERYTPEYIEKCFVAWYSAGRPETPIKIDNCLPVDDSNRKPKTNAVKKWRKQYEWDSRADDLDKKAIAIVEDTLIAQKAKMLERQAQTGFLLQELGLSYLISGSFDSSASAVQAVIRGAELERQSRGIGEIHARMVKMTDAELEADIIKDLMRASDAGQIIDGEELTGGDTDEETPE